MKKIRKTLFEGMRAGDLNNLVLPMLSIDEYESQIDPSAVAIGFYVHERDAANDLNRFLQKSPTEFLSSEVSPAPDQHGYYIVFIELLYNEELFDNLSNVLHEIEPLCEIETWKMHVRKSDKPLAFNQENFDEALKKAREEDKKDQEKNEDHSDVTEGSKLIMRDIIKVIETMGHNGGPPLDEPETIETPKPSSGKLSPVERKIMDEIKSNSHRQTHVMTFAGKGAKDGLKSGGRQRMDAAKRLRDKGLVVIDFLEKEFESRRGRTMEYSHYVVRDVSNPDGKLMPW